jgi:hypothetical protein
MKRFKMKTIFKILILALCFSSANGQDINLYPITKGNLWGYIDQTGKTIIKPQFYSAGQFSDGLAAVRFNGRYGYIDQNGKCPIEPKYDLALPFQNGIAKIFIDGKPFFIDKTGKIIFVHNFKTLSSFGYNTYSIVITQNDKYGVIDKSGKLIIDTVFKQINPFIDGLAIVQGLNHYPYSNDSTHIEAYEIGVIDTTGKWIIPYGRYKNIDNYKNGYTQAERFNQTEKERGWSHDDALIDKNGNQKFIVPAGKYFFNFDNPGYFEDLAVILLYPEEKDSTKMWSSNDDKKYMGVINPEGQILFSDTNWKNITPFTFNRAFVLNKREKWSLIDKRGKRVTDSVFDQILFDTYRDDPENLFANGIAYVKLSKGWVAIDTTGKILSQMQIFSDIDYDHINRIGELILFDEDISVENPDYSFRYGFWNAQNNSIVKPTYHYIDINGFNSKLIYAMKDGRKYYISNSGKIIWKEGKIRTRNKVLNIDFMNRGYFYASSEYKKELAGYGGWGGSDNKSKPVNSSLNQSLKQLQIIIDTSKKANWYGYNAMKLLVANASPDTLYFDAQDSRLYLKMQAQDKNGVWKDIEYLPSSWCGNSYHTLFLAPNELWEFSTPVYQGEFKTKIRAQLIYKKVKHGGDKENIYSNEIEGTINPGQFWNKHKYFPRGIMDPYND